MKNQTFNPYLPSYEYVPDVEPRVFDGRVYVYGSHDRFNAPIFCVQDYVCYSCPVEDLSDWRYEGIIYKKTSDPKNRLGLRLLFAPDVVQGTDGKYYLYYSFDFMGLIGVACSDSPAGIFKFLGYVHYSGGDLFGRRKGDPFPFDPAVLVDDDGKIYLYSGFYIDIPRVVTGGKKLKSNGGVVIELESDMLTIKCNPKLIFPKTGEGSFKDHEFFEASSIRKAGGLYYFVYSSRHNHELCYAVSNRPDGDFEFKGTLVSIGDVFRNGNIDEKKALNYLGNTHGGLLNLHDKWYIFYHRQTNRHSYSRQSCAEELKVNSDGDFMQAEVTSCGLNGGSLKGYGRYPSYIVCNLWSKYGCGRYDCRNPRRVFRKHPYLTQKGHGIPPREEEYIANIRDGSVAGFKYFDMQKVSRITVEVRGKGHGQIIVSEDKSFGVENSVIPVDLKNKKEYLEFSSHMMIEDGTKSLYFKYTGQGYIDFKSFTIE